MSVYICSVTYIPGEAAAAYRKSLQDSGASPAVAAPQISPRWVHLHQGTGLTQSSIFRSSVWLVDIDILEESAAFLFNYPKVRISIFLLICCTCLPDCNIMPVYTLPWEYMPVFCIWKIQSVFHNFPVHGSFHSVCWQMRSFCEMKLPCLGKQDIRHCTVEGVVY
jgi:hypothetical protein